jgi:hypothetical protein
VARIRFRDWRMIGRLRIYWRRAELQLGCARALRSVLSSAWPCKAELQLGCAKAPLCPPARLSAPKGRRGGRQNIPEYSDVKQRAGFYQFLWVRFLDLFSKLIEMKSKKSSNPNDGFIKNGKKYRSQTLRARRLGLQW